MKNRSALAWSDGAAGPVLADPPDRVPDWRELALCAEVGGDQWFPEQGESAAPAKRVCRSCPVTEPCLQYALDTDQRWGVWGGKSERERRRLKRRDDESGPTACTSGRHEMTAENRLDDGRCRPCTLEQLDRIRPSAASRENQREAA